MHVVEAERDRYKHHAEDLALEVARLRKQLDKLKPPTTRPAPASPAAPAPPSTEAPTRKP